MRTVLLEKFSDGPLRGFDPIVWGMVTDVALGCLLISVVMKYTDNICKSYAQGVAIIGTSLGSWIFFDFVPNTLFFFGTMLVTISIVLYSLYPYVPPVLAERLSPKEHTPKTASRAWL